MIERPLLRWLGGKYRLAPWIVGNFPPHRQYVEPYCGAASVLLHKPPAYNELINDLDGEIVNLFCVLRSAAAPELLRQLRLTPYALAEYEGALLACDDPVERARRLIVRAFMAHGSNAARLDRKPGFRSNGKSGTTNVAGEWATYPDALECIIERIRPVVIQQRPALELLDLFDDPKVLIYLDPPYLPETRSGKSKQAEGYHAYSHEMTAQDHEILLEKLNRSTAMICLSGYASELYTRQLGDWELRVAESRSHDNSARTECLWINRAAIAAMPRRGLFG